MLSALLALVCCSACGRDATSAAEPASRSGAGDGAAKLADSADGAGTAGTGAKGTVARAGSGPAGAGAARSPGAAVNQPAAANGADGANAAGGGGASSAVDSGGAGAGEASHAGSASGDVVATITNGDYWLDTGGARIEAHGAGLIRTQDAWYWIGEDKSESSANFKAVNCYRSTDLEHWELRHAIITRQTSSDLAAADRIIERPKVIYNDATKKYVMWLHWEGMSYATAEAGVFTSDTIDGDYKQVRHFRPNMNMSRDDTLFKDDDGKAYFLSAANNNADLALYELTEDYTDIKRQISTLWPGSYREAPAVVKVSGVYFLVSSGATGWDPNQQKYATATSMEGPWSALANLGDGTGFDTQTSFILEVKGTKATTYVYVGDRWQDPDLKSSKYIWLPLRVDGTTLALDYHERWELNVTTGEWSADDADKDLIAHTGWKVVSVDSEETQGEDGRAINALDGSAATFWHSQWQGSQPAPPHELVLDLGARHALTALRYTPRNDGNQNGMVAQYEVYVSESASDFGAAVASGSFGTSTTPTRVSFAEKAGRYVRFRALSERNGKAYTAVAELDLVGRPL